MNDQHLDRAVEFLSSMRPYDHGHASTSQRLASYRHELVNYMQVTAALRLAGFGHEPRMFRADDLVKCKNPSCDWAGPVEQLRQGLGQVTCPACNNLDFERIT